MVEMFTLSIGKDDTELCRKYAIGNPESVDWNEVVLDMIDSLNNPIN